MKKYRLKGHETFIIREGWLSKGIYEVKSNSQVFKENYGADALGVGSNMAKAIRFWLKTAKLINEKKEGVYLSQLGEIIFENDPYFEDYFTLWIVHCNIVENREMATSWNLFFNEFESCIFTKEDIVEFVKIKIETLYNEENVSQRSVQDDANAIINMYLGVKEDVDPEDKKVSPFSEFGLLKRNARSIQKEKVNCKTLSEYVILYCICDYIDEKRSISIDEILSGYNMPGKILGLNRIILNDYLDKLSQHGYIYINRTAGLDMVYGTRCLKKEDVLREYYKNNRQDK